MRNQTVWLRILGKSLILISGKQGKTDICKIKKPQFPESLMASNVANLSERVDGLGLLQSVFGGGDREDEDTCPEDRRCGPVCPAILKMLDMILTEQ